MGLFDFIKKDIGKTNLSAPSTKKDELFPSDFEHLTKDGELPWGWVSHNKVFTEKIQNEYSYFLDMWCESRNKSPKEQYQSLKSFVLYLEDVETLCKSKGECFEFWFYQIIAEKRYIEKRKQELEDLIANFDELQANYNKRTKSNHS